MTSFALERAIARQTDLLESVKSNLISLQRDRRRRQLRPSDVMVRAAAVTLLRREVRPNQLETTQDAVERLYSGCAATAAYLQRAATNPANTGTPTWAQELVGVAVADFLASDMAASAFTQLAERALSVSLPPGTGILKIPGRASPPVLSGGWVAEGGAKPVYAGAGTSTSLTPYKLAALSAFTEEMLTTSEIELIVRDVLAHDLQALLDTALLDATAASAVRPAGLFNGATSVTASTATPLSEAMLADLRGLHAAVATNNANARTVFVANPAQAIRIGITAPEYANLIVSGYMPVNTVGAVDASAIAMLVSQPEFALSRNAALHMENATPLALGTGTQGAGVLAVPLQSMFQQDAVALRSTLRASWAKRRTGATAIVSAVTW